MSIQNHQRKLIIGLFGFGVVGEGLYQVLHQTPSLNAEIRKVCIRHPEKKRNAPADLFTTDADLLLDDQEINVIVELINDAGAAFSIVSKALRNKKAVVSANKKMIAEHLGELLEAQQLYNVPLLYESACCASIPVVRNLEEYYDNDLLQGINGIVNGSTNYILSKIADERLDFDTALLQAQVEGFAESDPSLDVNGTDAANKLSILLAHAYGIVAQPGSLLYHGIGHIKDEDTIFAREKGLKVKLIAQARKLSDGRIAAFVLPQFVKQESQLYNVNDEYNGVVIESSLADKQFFYGKGAGSFPTASAVLSDISALRYDYRYEYKKLNYQRPLELTGDFYLRIYISFAALFHVPQDLFEQIESWSSGKGRCHVQGIIHYSRLIGQDWWRKESTSLIALPDAIVEHPEAIHTTIRRNREEFVHI